jgi:hypothetical protein
MKLKVCLLLIFIGIFLCQFDSMQILAQIPSQPSQPISVPSKFISADYDRCGISFVLVDAFSESRFDPLIATYHSTLSVPDKYFDNRIANDVIQEGVFSKVSPGSKENQISQAIRMQKLPNRVMDIIFASDGKTWKLDSLFKRGQYNMSDDQVLLLKNSAKGFTAGSENAIWSERIMKKSFIIALSPRNFQSMDEIYDRQDARNQELSRRSKGKIPYKPVDRLLRGYKGTIMAYCYKLSMNDTLMNEMWMNFSSKSKRDSMAYPLMLMAKTEFNVESLEPRKALGYSSDNVLLHRLMIDVHSKALREFELSVSDFRVRAALVSVRPPEAKVGLKEGVFLDQRFFVYENVMKNGQPVTVRRGVIRAKRVPDNRTIATGQSGQTKFYQVAGGRLDPGMLIEQKPDIGFSFFAGSCIPTTKNRNWFNGRLSVNLAATSHSDGTKGPPSQLRIFIDFDVYHQKGADSSTVQKYFGPNYKNNNLSTIGAGLGVQKDFHFLHHFQFSPFASVNFNNITYSDTNLNNRAKTVLGKDWGKTFSFKAGADLGINLTHNFKLVCSGYANTLSKNPSWNLPILGKATKPTDEQSNRIKMGLMVNVKLRYDI